MRTLSLSFLILIGGAGLWALPPLSGQETAKPAPAAVKAVIRFQIDAGRRQRLELYDAMVKRLTALGFKKEKGLEGEELYSDRMTGLLPAVNAARLSTIPDILTVLLSPADYPLPAGETPVLVRLHLFTRFGPPRQREVADRVRELLKPLGFQETVGHDHRQHTRLLGWLAAGKLADLLKDSMQITMPVEGVDAVAAGESHDIKIFPILRTEVLRLGEGIGPGKELTPAPVFDKERAFLEKISPELRGMLTEMKEEDRKKSLRIESILRFAPDDQDPTWQSALGGMTIEGRFGPIVTGTIAAGQIESLAAVPEVSTIRLPKTAGTLELPPFDGKNLKYLPVDFVSLSNIPSLRANRDVRIRNRLLPVAAVIAGDFRGYERFAGKGLPAKTQLVDLTGERRTDLLPDPPLPGEEVGAGTRIALAWLQTHAVDQLFLIRIDAESPYQIEDVARYIRGDVYRSPSLHRRQEENRRERDLLADQRIELRIERRLALDNFSLDEGAEKVRQAYRKRQADFDATELAFKQKSARLLETLTQIERLKNVATVVIGLHWRDGHPTLPGETSALRHLDRRLLQGTTWAQAMPRTQGDVWSGLFQDVDRDGAMDFSLPNQSATMPVDFLNWTPSNGEAAHVLPANAVVQLNLQWREVHSPEWKEQGGEDGYRKPLAALTMVVLRQVDPTGKNAPTDLFEVVARAGGWPDRLENQPRYAIYQSTLRFQVGDKPGRYAVRIEGKMPESTLPPTAPKLPNQERWELRPILRAEVLEAASRKAGRVGLELPGEPAAD